MLSSAHEASDIRIFQKEARTLARAGYDVTFVVPHDRDEVVDGVRVRALAIPRSRLWRMLASFPLMLRAALGTGAEVCHFHDPELIPVGLALKALGRSVVYDAHEDLPKSILGKTYLPSWLRRPAAWAVHQVEKAASGAFDLVVVATEGILRSFHHHPRAVLIRNYPMLSQFESTPRRAGEGSEVVVAYSGGLTAARGAREMVAAVERLPGRVQIRLVILGRFWPEALEQEVRVMPGFARVDFRGWVSHAEVAEQLGRAEIGLVCFLPEPNHLEAGPNKLFEYMAAELPVVASDFPAWREIVEGNHCGICVDPTNPDAIATAIEYLADHPARRAEMGANGRRAVLEWYNWEAEGRRLVAAYAGLRPRKAASPAGGRFATP